MSRSVGPTDRPIPDDWAIKSLSSVSENGASNGYFKKPELVGSGYKLVNVSELYQPFGIDTRLESVERVAADEKDLRKYGVREGDIFFTRSSLVLSGIAACNIVAKIWEPTLFECHVMKVTPDKEQVCPKFIAYSCRDSYSRKYLMAHAKQTTMTTISQPEIESMPVPVAPLPEQRKIARILTTLDNLIEKTEALIAKYQSIKQGMMHDLFTRGVDESGRLRPTHEQAPDLYKQSELGWIPKQWEVRSTLDLASEESGSTTLGPFGSDLVSADYRTTGVPVVFVRDIKENHFFWKSNVFVGQGKADSLRAHSVRAGDIVVTKMGLPPCVAAIYSDLMPPGIITADIIRHRPNKSLADTVWLCAALNDDSTKRQVAAITAGVTRPKVTLADYRNLKVACPSLDEQTEIARRLTALNRKVGNEQSALQKHQLVKSGLMQDLLTGKVRVNVE